MVALPRVVIAAPASGHGKTTVATGLMAALTRAGHTVSGHKVGPDYIDPGYHALATGRAGRNLDPHLVGEDLLVPLLLHGAREADVAVVEGVMGLYDGHLDADGFASTAHVATATSSPVVLVVDISHASRSIAAVIHGLATWGRSNVVGVILNKAGSERHADEVVRAIGETVPVLGVLRRDDGIEAPSRHLGLVPAAERDDAARALDRLAAQVAERVDLERVVALARSAPELDATPWEPAAALAATDRTGTGLERQLEDPAARHSRPVADAPAGPRPRIAMAGGRAFTFTYAETTELLEAAGAEVVEFDPLTDPSLPPGTRGLYLGGGFPEMHAADLAANTVLREEIRAAVDAGLPTVAECAGLLYLCRSVRGTEGPAAQMTGVLDVDVVMAPKLTLAYRTASSSTDTLLTRRGEQVTGHEFHRTRLVGETGGDPAWLFPDPAGIATATLHASYLHTHWAGHPQLAARFVEAAGRHMPGAGALTPRMTSAASEATERPDLRHHGDREVGAGLLDFAVNVYAGPRPSWLDEALTASLDELAAYPDPTAAEAAVALHHDREPAEVLATAGVAEAFTLMARLRDWRNPAIVHPQFTEPDVALAEAGHRPEHVLLTADAGFRLDPAAVPEEADLVVVGNPTNPTGVRHPADTLRALARPGRVLLVDEAFCDDGVGSLAGEPLPGVVVLRSLTKLWAIPGLRAGYLLAEPALVAELREHQTPWSVSTPAAAALTACSTPEADVEAKRRAAELAGWRDHLAAGLGALGIEQIPSSAPFVLARLGAGARERLREAGFAVRRADTFPGLDATWARIAARPTGPTDDLLTALTDLMG